MVSSVGFVSVGVRVGRVRVGRVRVGRGPQIPRIVGHRDVPAAPCGDALLGEPTGGLGFMPRWEPAGGVHHPVPGNRCAITRHDLPDQPGRTAIEDLSEALGEGAIGDDPAGWDSFNQIEYGLDVVLWVIATPRFGLVDGASWRWHRLRVDAPVGTTGGDPGGAVPP